MTTTSYTSPIQSSFTANPLTTTFTPAATCTGAYYSGGVFVLGEDPDCKPSGFADASTDYFSPGLSCPSGYYTACHDNEGVSSITTVTCCPAIGDISLGCVTPSTLSEVWSTLFCTWIAPADDATTVSVTLSSGGTTSTVAESMSSPGGLNAQGIRMVYEATDISTSTGSGTATATATGTSSATATSTSSSSSSSSSASSSSSDNSSSLSTGATAAIAVVIAVVGIGGIIGVFFWLRKRKQRREQQQQQYGAVGAGPNSPTMESGPGASAGGMDYKYTGQYAPVNRQELSGVGAQGVRNQQQELVELGPHSHAQQQQQQQQQYNQPSELGSEQPVELPASDHWR